MEKNKFLRIIHMILVLLGISIYTYILIKYNSHLSRIICIGYITNIAVFLLGFIYLIMNYSKNAAKYYKAFMWLVVISEIIENTAILSSYTPNIADIFKNNINLVLFTLIAGAKDYGNNNSKLIVIALVIFNVYALIDVTTLKNGIADYTVLDRIGQLLIVAVTSLMVYGKYFDKGQRGTN